MKTTLIHTYLRRTFQLAHESVKQGNHPFGALLVIGGQAVMEANNTVHTDNDICRHAELNLVTQAVRTFTADQLKVATLYSSTEPCVMCTGAIYWSGIRSVVFGCSSQRLGQIAGGPPVQGCREAVKLFSTAFAVTGPLLESEAEATYLSYWQQL